jgi:hypothetical protein
MGLFRRGRRGPGSPPDEVLTFMPAEQANRLRALMRESFAEAGLEVTVYADHLVDAAGREFGVGNLARACHNDERGERAWPQIVRDHVGRVLRSLDAPSPFETFTPEQVRANTWPRLYEAANLSRPEDFRYATETAPGLVEVLNLDLPESVAFFTDDNVAQFGPYPVLRAAALANLRTLPVEEYQVLRDGEVSVHVLTGESLFVATLVLLLPEVLARYGEPVPERHGVLVATPFRHQLAFHPIRDASVLPSLTALARFADAGYTEGVGGISPHVYWWRDGELRQITTQHEDGIVIEMDDDFAEVLTEVIPEED